MSAEHLEKLSEDLSLLVSKEHTFGTDAFLLARFAHATPKDRAADFGTGCGIIPFLWHRDHMLPSPCYAVDIQAQAIEQCQHSIELAQLQGRIQPILSDIRTLSQIEPASLTLIACNPPYKQSGGGIISRDLSDQIARHETMCTLEELCAVSSRFLQFGGRFCICQRPERLCDIIDTMRKYGMEPKRLQFVHRDSSSAPWLILVEGRRGGKPFLKVEPPFLMYENGKPSVMSQALYRPWTQMEEPKCK